MGGDQGRQPHRHLLRCNWQGAIREDDHQVSAHQSTIHEAHDATLGTRVAIKIMRGNLPSDPVDRFRREAHVQTALSHEHIARIIPGEREVGSNGGHGIRGRRRRPSGRLHGGRLHGGQLPGAPGAVLRKLRPRGGRKAHAQPSIADRRRSVTRHPRRGDRHCRGTTARARPVTPRSGPRRCPAARVRAGPVPRRCGSSPAAGRAS